ASAVITPALAGQPRAGTHPPASGTRPEPHTVGAGVSTGSTVRADHQPWLIHALVIDCCVDFLSMITAVKPRQVHQQVDDGSRGRDDAGVSRVNKGGGRTRGVRWRARGATATTGPTAADHLPRRSPASLICVHLIHNRATLSLHDHEVGARCKGG